MFSYRRSTLQLYSLVQSSIGLEDKVVVLAELHVEIGIASIHACLVNAAHQFHNRTSKDERYLLAGYPWFKCRARDTFIALPGLTLSIEEEDYFELVMQTASRGLYEFMEGKPLTTKIYEIEQPDVLLWQYGLYSSMPSM